MDEGWRINALDRPGFPNFFNHCAWHECVARVLVLYTHLISAAAVKVNGN
jgi:hypothetical protein